MKTENIIKQGALLKTKTVNLKGMDLTVRYAELGHRSNPTILMLHGVPENLQAWYAVAPRLAEKYHIIALDWPGFGGSEPFKNHADYDAKVFAKVGVSMLDALWIEKAHVMATDIGLLPAFIMGLDYPDRIMDLVVMDGIPFNTTAYSSWELKSFQKKGSLRAKALIEWFPKVSALIAYNKGFRKGHNIPKDVLQEFLEDGKNPTNQKAFLAYFQNFHKGQKYFESRAHQMQKQVLVLWGSHDRFIDVALAHEITQKLPNARLEIIEDAGHYVHMDQPDSLLEASLSFLQEHEASIMPVAAKTAVDNE